MKRHIVYIYYVFNWAAIISYDIIRMDGVTMGLPETNIPAKLMNWKNGKFERFDAPD